MQDDKKFCVTPTRILDAESVADVEYFPVGTRRGADVLTKDGPKPNLLKKSEFHLRFKDGEQEGVFLFSEEADKAWLNFRRVSGSTLDQMMAFTEHVEFVSGSEKKTP